MATLLNRLRILGVAMLLTCVNATWCASQTVVPGDLALDQIPEAVGVRGGMVVLLGADDGRNSAALRVDDKFTVHGLAWSDASLRAARAHIAAAGLYGPVSIDRIQGESLPYVDDLVNLLVAAEPGDVSLEEMLRVVAPGGSVVLRSGDSWHAHRKPRPAIDDWTHFLHDASNNAVADDQEVGPPRSLQWVAPPLWLRSHETPSGVQSSVTGGGRLFYFFDEGLIGITDQRLPDRWSLVCRDAFNGKLLWKRPLEEWGWREWNYDRYAGKDWLALRAARVDVPNQNQRRLVVDGDRLYVTLGYEAPMSIVDAASGRTIKTVESTRGTSEILASQGIAIAYISNRSFADAQRKPSDTMATAGLVAVDGATGEVLWQRETNTIRPLFFAIQGGRIVYETSSELVALDLKTGDQLWSRKPERPGGITLVVADGVVVISGNTTLDAYDAADGRPLWTQKTPRPGGIENQDLFVADGIVWRGVISVDYPEGDKQNPVPVRKSSNVLLLGFDLLTGEEVERVAVDDLRSPEHHHRCYRNKATTRYLMTGLEGVEFVDLQEDDHSQNNWLRGACRYGIMPANGMLYIPPDQCFCQPGAKLLGYAAVKSGPASPPAEIDDTARLIKGPAYGEALNAAAPAAGDWPTFRHDAARSGATRISVAPEVQEQWRAALSGKLTAPVVVGGVLLVAEVDAHRVHALNAATGERLWQFTAGGRIDSPPTIDGSRVLFGSKDGSVYCLRLVDGALAWRFIAAPADRRMAYYDQIESVWPCHGSVLVVDGVAYFTAGRSSYLDGGIRIWGVDAASGEILHKQTIEGPHRQWGGERDVAFYTPGARSDVLVAEDGYIYMRQKKLTPKLERVDVPVLSSKGEMDIGTHIFSTAGLLDDSWYNRTFWMYAGRWPGFQLANQAPKTGQILVHDDERTFALRVFYYRNVHSPMFFPGTKGYLVFADANTNEPQIVGEEGARTPVEWLPQSTYVRGGNRPDEPITANAFGLDKMTGYTRAEPPLWTQWIKVRARAMVKAGQTLFLAGPPDQFDPADPYAAFEGRVGGRVVALSAADGELLSAQPLDAGPVFDGLIAAGGRLYMSTTDGTVLCLGGER